MSRILTTLIIAVVAFVSPGMVVPQGANATEWVLAPNTEYLGSPAIWGTRVVFWEDHQIVFYDLSTGASRRLYGGGAALPGSPAIWGDNVVYNGWDANNVAGLYCYNLKTRRTTRLATDSCGFGDPVIYRSKVAYFTINEHMSSDYTDVYVYDLETRTETRIAQVPNIEMDGVLDIWGDNVIYPDWDQGISCYNLSTGKTRRITRADERPSKARICGDRVVYESHLGLVVHNLSTGITRRFVAEGNTPAIWGRRVLYLSALDAKFGLSCSDLETDEQTVLTMKSAPTGGDMDVWGNTAVYIDEHHHGWDEYHKTIHLYDFRPAPALGAPVASSIFYREKPRTVYGFLKPKHTAGTKSVLIHRWKKTDGKWVHRGYVRATASDYSTYTKYSTTIEFPSTGEWKLRAYSPGDTEHAPRWSGADYVTVKDVTVGTPDAPATIRADTDCIVKGYLKPRHAAGTKPVRIYKWEKVDEDEWEARGYVTASVYDYETYSRYRAKIDFSVPGEWRLRAYHPEDEKHRARWSKYYEYVTVTK